jgi:DNA-binding transcriptional LysR family regulator
MAKNEPDWNLYRSFLQVMREGSLSAAARTLGTAQPTVGRHIEALEAALGVKLFTRAPDGLIPTEAARRLGESAESMSSLSKTIMRMASAGASEEGGTVRITASEVIGVEVLPPMLVRLREAHPALSIELALSNRNEDMLHGAADVAVRMARPVQDALVVKRLGAVRLGLFAHRDYVKRHGMPNKVQDLASHALIGFDRDPAFMRLAQSWGLSVAREDFAFRSDSDHAQLAALRSGGGIGVCQAGVALGHPELVPILADSLRFSLDMWLAMHRDRRNERRVRIVFDHLARELGAYAGKSA